MIMIRYADDLVVGFQRENDARRFWDAMRERLRQFWLSLHADKTRLIEFGRFAVRQIPTGRFPNQKEVAPRPHAYEAPGNQGSAATTNAQANS
jgi:hypothetical protein